MKVRAEKDLIAGLVYVGLAAAFLWFGRDYRMGSASNMGPGFFPITLAWTLAGFGVVSVTRSLLKDGDRFDGIAWKRLAAITLAIGLFGFLIGTAGLIVAIPVLVIIAAFASDQSVYNATSLLALTALTALCVIVFVKGLGVPMPIFGSWFDGVVPVSWQR